jgi:hypothetical protein
LATPEVLLLLLLSDFSDDDGAAAATTTVAVVAMAMMPMQMAMEGILMMIGLDLRQGAIAVGVDLHFAYAMMIGGYGVN